MNKPIPPEAFGVVTEPATLTIQRRLPGPIDRVWAYLTDDALRRQWLAAGEMELTAGSSFELVWRNGELTASLGKRPAGMPEEHRMRGRIIAAEAPRKLVISWGVSSEVTFALDVEGSDVLLTVIHRRLPDRANMLNVAAGWHAHLGVLVARMNGAEPESFWDTWSRLKTEYERRIPS